MSRTCATQIANRIAKTALCSVVWLTAIAASAVSKPDDWVEVRSPHFVVATNSNEKQGRRVADQFERMRSVFHAAFPSLQIDLGSPIIVLACKDEKTFRAVEPEAYLTKGSLRLGGLFLRALDKNYVLLRLDAEGDHPYAVVYHEYTHLLMHQSAEWIPLWLDEGLAQFYQNSDIGEKDVVIGKPSDESLLVLWQHGLLPLATLFQVDYKSPYYHEEDKGSIFYAESWALTHYLHMKDEKEKTHKIPDYLDLLKNKKEPLEAARSAFGDLQLLQQALQSYIQRRLFFAIKMRVSIEIDDSKFETNPLPEVQADALRADLLAYEQRDDDARALLDHVLQEDPKSASACETMGFLAFRQRHLEEAGKWYTQAVQLDSQNYLAHYYSAAIAMNEGLASADESRIETSLRTAIKLNPSFAPSYNQLAVLLGKGRRNLDEARVMELKAVSHDPATISYRVNMANILLEMQQGENAIRVLQLARKLAKTPEESLEVENALMNAQLYTEQQERHRQNGQGIAEQAEATVEEQVVKVDAPAATHDTFVAKGPHQFLTGTLKNVRCAMPALDLTVEGAGKTLTLHSENVYKIEITTLGFTPRGELNPCQDLEGRPAKVEYIESVDESAAARVLSIELHK
jgi:tetratricopeptide (TPR) repeat protein